MDRLRNAAIILLGVGEKNAAEILKSMDPKEVRAIIEAINTIDNVSEEDMIRALNEFFMETNHSSGIDMASKEQIKNSILTAMGNKGISSILRDTNNESQWLELVRMQPVQAVVDMFQDEHPQIVTSMVIIVFNNLGSETGTKLIKSFPKNVQSQIFRRMTTMGSISRFAIDVLGNFFTNELENAGKNNVVSVDGLETMANIISYLDNETEREIMNELTNDNKALGEKIQDKIFPFQRLAELDKKSLQYLLNEVKNEDLVIALKGVDERVKEVFLQNMSSKSAEILKDDIEARGPVKLAHVLDAQKSIIRLAKKLDEEEKIVLSNKNNPDVVF